MKKLLYRCTTLSALLLLLAACSSDARFHEIQSARLGECAYKADKEFHECVQAQQNSYDEYKAEQQDSQQ